MSGVFDATESRMRELIVRMARVVDVSLDNENQREILAEVTGPGSIAPYQMSSVAVQAVRRKLSEWSTNPQELNAQYENARVLIEDLSSRYNDDEASDYVSLSDVDRFLYLLSKIGDDRALIVMLGRSEAQRLRQVQTDKNQESGGQSYVERQHAIEAAITKRAVGTSSKPTETPQSTVKSIKAESTKNESPAKLSELSSTSLKPKETRKIPFPGFPAWVEQRERRAANALTSSVGRHGSSKCVALGTLPTSVQEILIIEDVLNALMGISGNHVYFTEESTASGSVSLAGSRLRICVSASVDASLKDLVLRILPVALHHCGIQAFIEKHSSYGRGLVVQALCSAVREFLKEYLVLVAQLEHQSRLGLLTIQKLWFYIQPSTRLLASLHSLLVSIDQTGVYGGALLNVIHASAIAQGGDAATRDMFYFLTQRASAPFFRMLERWIYEGKLGGTGNLSIRDNSGIDCDGDPHGEFMVEEHRNSPNYHRDTLRNPSIKRGEGYWEKRFTLRSDHQPVFLDRVADKILRAGKYLNVIAESGIIDDTTLLKSSKEAALSDLILPMNSLTYTQNDREYTEKIEKAYEHASSRLLNLLLQNCDLVGRLLSIKHYFLLDYGDFFVHFLDIAEDELKKNSADVSSEKLSSLLDLALRTSVAKDDPYSDYLFCHLEMHTLLKQITTVLESESHSASVPAESQEKITNPLQNVSGLELFSLEFSVDWPLSLVLSKRVMLKYQLIFRHLSHCKHVERQLCRTWQSHQTTKQFDLRSAFTASFCLQQRMLNFVQSLQYYTFFEVLEPRSIRMLEMIRDRRKVATVDDLMQVHEDFLDACFKECMLKNTRLLKICIQLMSICIVFSAYIDKLLRTLTLVVQDSSGINDKKYGFDGSDVDLQSSVAVLRSRATRNEVVSNNAKHVIEDKGYARTIRKFEENFDSHLKLLIGALNAFATSESCPMFSNLSGRLDFNGFYAGYFSSTK